MQDGIRAGDEIITAGGIHGEVVRADGEVVQVRIAPDVVVDLDRRAIAAVAVEERAEEEDDDAEPLVDDAAPLDDDADPAPEEAREAR
jgi:preprotein translocase subunit YajC